MELVELEYTHCGSALETSQKSHTDVYGTIEILILYFLFLKL